MVRLSHSWANKLFKFLWSPFTPFLAITFACNLALVFWGYQTLLWNSDCEQGLWLRGNAIFALINIHGSLYLVVLMHREKVLFKTLQWWYNPGQMDDIEKQYYLESDEYDDDSKDIEKETSYLPRPITTSSSVPAKPAGLETTDDTDDGHSLSGQASYVSQSELESSEPPATTILAPSNKELVDRPCQSSHERLGRVLYNDAGVVCYICVAVLWIIWQSIGIRLVLGMLGEYEEDGECGMVRRWIKASLICGGIYLFVAFVAFDCSLLCIR